MRKIYFILFLLLIILAGYKYGFYGYAYYISEPTDEIININQDPIMLDPENVDFIIVDHDKYDIRLEVVKEYTIFARVLYLIDTRSVIERFVGLEAMDADYIPIDLVTGWGKLIDYDYAIKAYHLGAPNGRRATLDIDYEKIEAKVGKDYSLCDSENTDHCWSHNHIIPANEEILTGLKHMVNLNKNVKLKGYLVNIHKTRNNQEIIMKTSTSLSDYDCEFFYVKELIINNRLFK